MAISLQMHIWITVQTLINIPLSAYPSIPSDHREVENYILQYTKPKDKFYTQNTLIRRNRILKINGCEKIKNNYIIWRKKFVLKFSFAVFAPQTLLILLKCISVVSLNVIYVFTQILIYFIIIFYRMMKSLRILVFIDQLENTSYKKTMRWCNQAHMIAEWILFMSQSLLFCHS